MDTRWPAIATLNLILISAAGAQPPSDEQIAAAVKWYQEGREGFERADPRVAEALRELSIEDMTAAQIEALGLMIDLAPAEIRGRMRARLRTLAQANDADGAAAAAQLPRLVDPPVEGAPPSAGETFDRERLDAILAAAAHPGFSAAIHSGRATGVYYWMYFYGEHPRVRAAAILARLAGHIDDSWPTEHLFDLTAFVETAISPGAGLDEATVRRLREVTTRLAQRALSEPNVDEHTRDGLLQVLKTINSAAARGALVGHPAPALHFLWTSASPGPATLADLRGKVVVLDFWATWCGPCIASFPHTRALQERYAGSPVVLLGVTALQGWILDAKADDPAERRVTGLTPDDELARLARWARDMNMTWMVAVSREKLFNPDYGVRGIPSVVIIDAAGVVRHAGLSPTDRSLEERIDALLREAGVEPPPARR